MEAEITPELICQAYACGLFPMAMNAEDEELHWINPEERCILPLTRFHTPRRLARTMRNAPWELRLDTDFAQVINACAMATEERPSTWINQPIKRLYEELFDAGICHSVELWQGDKLIAGLYGVQLGAAFFGESMFTKVRDGSKAALVHLVRVLNHGGFKLLDAQFETDHLRQFGAEIVPRVRYLQLLREAINTGAAFELPPK